MIQKITSKRVELPPIWLVETKEDFDSLPVGLPRIVAPMEDLEFVKIYLEFQVLLKSCKKTGMKINWLDCLRRIGFKNNLKEYQLQSGGEYWSADTSGATPLSIDDFVEDTYIVDFDKLAELKILPVWLEDLKLAVETNIINEVLFDPTAFNKQLGMNIGAGAVSSQKKNLLILDISGSIPDGIRLTIIQLSKLMSKRFYADVIFTGGSTVFIDYEDVFTKDIKAITDGISRNNEGEQFKAIVEQVREYGTCICFGDDDCPAGNLNSSSKLTPLFQIDTLYSLHTQKESNNLTGYCKDFKDVKNVIKVKDWVTSITK